MVVSSAASEKAKPGMPAMTASMAAVTVPL